MKFPTDGQYLSDTTSVGSSGLSKGVSVMNVFYADSARSFQAGAMAPSMLSGGGCAKDLDLWVRVASAKTVEDSFRPRLSAEQWSTLAGYLTRSDLRSGETLLNQGDTDRSLYFLLDGTLQIYVTPTTPGTAGRVMLVREGCVLGEQGLFGSAPRLANAEAMTPCSLLILRAQRLDELTQRSPALGAEVLRAAGAVMMARMRALANKQAITV